MAVSFNFVIFLQHTDQYRPFTVNTTVQYYSNMEGRHRHVLNIYAYDTFNVRRPKSYCFEIKGEYVKVK